MFGSWISDKCKTVSFPIKSIITKTFFSISETKIFLDLILKELNHMTTFELWYFNLVTDGPILFYTLQVHKSNLSPLPLPTAISRWIYQFSSDHWSQAASSPVSTWMGDRLGSRGAVGISFCFLLNFNISKVYYLPMNISFFDYFIITSNTK